MFTELTWICLLAFGLVSLNTVLVSVKFLCCLDQGGNEATFFSLDEACNETSHSDTL